MSTSMTVSEARAALPRVLDRVLAGEEVTITRHGRPVAVVVRPDALRIRRADSALAAAGAVRELLEKGRAGPLPARGGLTEERAEALIAEVRAGRSAR
jgi:antitoxin (DNA-binding transcriptional repressor) of toxin-antitoxin stability system